MTLDSVLRIDFRKISKETENQIANCCNNNNKKKAAAAWFKEGAYGEGGDKSLESGYPLKVELKEHAVELHLCDRKREEWL